MKKLFISSLILLLCGTVQAQQLSLKECFNALESGDPAVRQKAVEERLTGLREANIRAERLPQVSVNAQATWQSEVTSLPLELPGVDIPTLSKDQYRITADVNYALYDGGLTKTRLALEALSHASQNLQLDAELLKQQQQVLEAYVRAMLFEKNANILEEQKKVLEARHKKLIHMANEGLVMQNQVSLLEKEQLLLEQKIAEAYISKSQNLQSLRTLTGLNFSSTVELQKLETINQPSADFSERPELQLMEQQRAGLGLQDDLQEGLAKPKVALFGQGGYGRPGLNFLENSFSPWYMGGIRISWDLGSLYSLRRKKEISNLSTQIIDLNEERLTNQLKTVYDYQVQEVERLGSEIERDNRIIRLSESITKAYAAQLDEGIITSDTYLNQLNQENQARLALALHETQLLLALHSLGLLTGM
ncbi:MAG: TolC family protein [Bacteroidia bacterium]